MDELERDPMVTRWTRHHGLRISYRKWWGGRGRYEPDFLVELVGGGKELREVKGDHLLSDLNTVRKLRSGDGFCRERGMVFRVITKSAVDPENWSIKDRVVVEDVPRGEEPNLSKRYDQVKPFGCLTLMLFSFLFLFFCCFFICDLGSELKI